MKKFLKKYWALALAVIVILLNAWMVIGADDKKYKGGTEVKADSTVYVDTVPYLMPIPKDSLVLRYDTLRVPMARSQKRHDSVAGDSVTEVAGVPIVQKVYRDTSYVAWVSGYRPCLDSIKVLAMTKYVTRTVTIAKPPERARRLVVGPSIGYGVTPDGRLRPYIGVGLSYNLFGF